MMSHVTYNFAEQSQMILFCNDNLYVWPCQGVHKHKTEKLDSNIT